jgi:hypothetical protein
MIVGAIHESPASEQNATPFRRADMESAFATLIFNKSFEGF